MWSRSLNRGWAVLGRSFHRSPTYRVSDPKAEKFFEEPVRDALQRLTGLDYDRVFRVAKRGQEIAAPTYAFLTDEQLKQAQAEAKEKALRLLQMPPVMSARGSDARILEEDPGIRGYDSAKLVVTDITYGIPDRQRIVVVRQPDGVLREASGEERDRMNQIYFPQPDRKIYTPALFESEDHLEAILGPEKYQHVLDHNCSQFDPDHPVHVRTAEYVYEHLNARGHFDVLKSTRHYGPLVFHLAWNKKCDDLLAHYFARFDLASATDVIFVFSKLHADSHVGGLGFDPEKDGGSEEKCLSFVRAYIKNDSIKSAKVHGALESMLEAREKNLKAERAAQDAHLNA